MPNPDTDVTLPKKRTPTGSLESAMSSNAYENILPARYMMKDETGGLVEDQEEVFERVAKNIALAEVVFEARSESVTITARPDQIKPDHPRRGELAAEVFGIDSEIHNAPEDIPRHLEDARSHLEKGEVELTEENINKFEYSTIISEVPVDIQETVESVASTFQGMMERLAFMPNSPTIMNAGDELQQLSACFVDSPADDIDDIHQTAKEAASIFQSGGGMGYSFSDLRPYGDPVGSTGGIASGAITFMRTFDQMCETIAQGGARRGAQMGIMKVSHPDVIQFIHAKNKDVSLAETLRLNDPDDFTHNSFAEALEEAREILDSHDQIPKHLRNAVEGHLSNFNISVGVTDDFMEALEEGGDFTFTNPRTGEPHIVTPETKELYDMFDLGEYVEVGEELSVPAGELWSHIVDGAHENGEPGLIFLDRVNKEHSFDPEAHPDHEIKATNPCLTGDMEVQIEGGETARIGELAVNDDPLRVQTLGDDGNIVTREAVAFKTKEDADVLKLMTEDGQCLRLTPDHQVRKETGEWVEAQDLEVGDEIVSLSKMLATPSGPEREATSASVAEIVSDGSEDVYDLRVEETHNFFASSTGQQGLNVHNCGEQPLEEYEACNLGHINLSTLVADDAPDWRAWSAEHRDEYDSLESAIDGYLEEAIRWDELMRRVKYGVRFLDNVVTMSDFPVEKIEETVREMRKVGLGVMGLAQLYIQLGVRYGSDEGDVIANQLMKEINHKSKWVSHSLAKDRGAFAEWDKCKYASPTEYPDWFEKQTDQDPEDWSDEGYLMRNHNTTTVAPTGTTSMLGNTSGGIEPIYNVAYYKNVSDDVQGDEMLVEFDDYFLRTLEANGIDVDEVKAEAEEQMANNVFDGVVGLETVPDAIGELFVTTGDLSARQHASVQCACQEGVDSSISKTVNAPNDSTVEDAKEVFEFIYEHGGKGVTYYRDGTRSKQVLTTRADNKEFDEMDATEAAEELAEGINAAFDDPAEAITEGALSETLAEHGIEVSMGSSNGVVEKEPRPDVLDGKTQRLETGYGRIYVNINEDPETGRPFEIFANMGNSGGLMSSFTEALAKVISTSLRCGVPAEEISSELRGIRAPKVAWDKGEQVNSVPDGIGLAMERQQTGKAEGGKDRQQNLGEVSASANGQAPADQQVVEQAVESVERGNETASTATAEEATVCPECLSDEIYYSEGCKTCESCGWSEC